MALRISVCENDTDVISNEIPICDEKKIIAIWKDKNAVKILIYEWKIYQSLFESNIKNNMDKN